jgi:cullin 1
VVPQNVWPSQQLVSFSLPSEMERVLQRFTTFYCSEYSGRKLHWLPQTFTCELVTNCFKNRYTLKANGLQMAVLLQYNDSTSFSEQETSKSLKID